MSVDGTEDIDMHIEVLEEEGPKALGGLSWRWHCLDCGRKGQFNYQSEASTLHQGRQHIALGRCKGKPC